MTSSQSCYARNHEKLKPKDKNICNTPITRPPNATRRPFIYQYEIEAQTDRRIPRAQKRLISPYEPRRHIRKEKALLKTTVNLPAYAKGIDSL